MLVADRQVELKSFDPLVAVALLDSTLMKRGQHAPSEMGGLHRSEHKQKLELPAASHMGRQS